jgi:hypothetical protein
MRGTNSRSGTPPSPNQSALGRNRSVSPSRPEDDRNRNNLRRRFI